MMSSLDAVLPMARWKAFGPEGTSDSLGFLGSDESFTAGGVLAALALAFGVALELAFGVLPLVGRTEGPDFLGSSFFFDVKNPILAGRPV